MAKESGIRIVKNASAPNEGASFVDAESTPKKAIQELSPEEEQQRLKELDKALLDIRFIGVELPYRPIKAHSLLYREDLSRAETFFTFTTTIAPVFNTLHKLIDYGSFPNKESSAYGAYLKNAYLLARATRSYFHDVDGSEDWYRSVAVSLGDECLNQLSDKPSINAQATRGERSCKIINVNMQFISDIDARLDVANAINADYPLDQYDTQATSLIKIISDTLKGDIRHEYYAETRKPTPHSYEFGNIQRLAQKYNIELPSEEELFGKDIEATIQKAEEAIESMPLGVTKENPYQPGSSLKNAKSAIESVRDILKEASEHFNAAQIPLGKFRAVADPVAYLEAKLENATRLVIQNNYKKSIEYLKGCVFRTDNLGIISDILRNLITFQKNNALVVSGAEVRRDIEEIREEYLKKGYYHQRAIVLLNDAIKELQE